MNKIKRIAIYSIITLTTAVSVIAQQTTTGVTRRTTGDRTRNAQTGAPGVTPRMQNHYDDAGTSITDADRQWMRVIYRQIDLDNDTNAALYYPEETIDGQENLFRIIMRLLANNQIAAYEYLDGREVFTDQYRIKVKDLLDRFHIIYTDAKGSTEKNPRFVINESDVPTNEVLSYYIIERWEFDTRQNRMKTIVEAICPVLHRSGDFGGEAIKYPMFWLKYSDLRPWLAQQMIFVNDDNNIPTATYDEFFNLTMYKGEIYKTRNLRNRSMAQIYPEPEQLKHAQDSIQNRLETFENKLWVPDREDVINGGKDKKNKELAAGKAEVSTGGSTEAVEQSSADDNNKSTKRTTKRTTKKTKTQKVKQSKPKSDSSSSATRSVRRRK